MFLVRAGNTYVEILPRTSDGHIGLDAKFHCLYYAACRGDSTDTGKAAGGGQDLRGVASGLVGR